MLNSSPRYLLLLSCAQRKRPDPGDLPAWDRYTGPAYQVLHKAQREGRLASGIDIYILSAEFGLIAAETPLPFYDRRMTPPRARELAPSVGAALDTLLAATPYQHIFLMLGATYRRALADSALLGDPVLAVQAARGGIGQHLAQLKTWLQHPGTAGQGSN